MMRFSIWKLPNIESLEHVSSLLARYAKQDVDYDHPDWPTGDPLIRRFYGGQEGISFRIQSVLTPGGTEARFVYTVAHSEWPKREQYWRDQFKNYRPHDERVNTAKAAALFFERNGTVYCAIQTQQARSLEHLKSELFLSDHWGVFQDAMDYWVDTDFYYWLLARFLRHNGQLGASLEVLNLSAYQAHALEETHTTRGEGERVTELLPTLANIFGNDPFRSMRLEIQYGEDFAVFTYDRTGGSAIEEGLYKGKFVGSTIGELRKALIAYFVYTELLPALIHQYRAFDKTQWSVTVREEFIHSVGMDMLSRIAKNLRLDLDKPLRDHVR